MPPVASLRYLAMKGRELPASSREQVASATPLPSPSSWATTPAADQGCPSPPPSHSALATFSFTSSTDLTSLGSLDLVSFTAFTFGSFTGFGFTAFSFSSFTGLTLTTFSFTALVSSISSFAFFGCPRNSITCLFLFNFDLPYRFLLYLFPLKFLTKSFLKVRAILLTRVRALDDRRLPGSLHGGTTLS